VITTHLPSQRTFAVHGLDGLTPSRRTFPINGGGEVSVQEHMWQTYQRQLHRENLPCVVERILRAGRVQLNYHPMEVLELLPNQRVSLDKQTPRLVGGWRCSFQDPPNNYTCCRWS